MTELYNGMLCKENSKYRKMFFSINHINKNKDYAIIIWIENGIEFEQKMSLMTIKKFFDEKVWIHCIKEERKRKIKEIRDL